MCTYDADLTLYNIMTVYSSLSSCIHYKDNSFFLTWQIDLKHLLHHEVPFVFIILTLTLRANCLTLTIFINITIANDDTL